MAKCFYCGKSLNFLTKYVCACCGKEMCSKCREKVRYDGDINKFLCSADDDYVTPNSRLLGSHYLCKDCSPQYEVKYKRMLDATENHADVRLVSENYLGDRFDRLTKIKSLQSSWYRDKHDAQEELKSMAKYLGCTHVLNFYFDRDECEEKGPKGGTHIYSVWSAIGVAAK